MVSIAYSLLDLGLVFSLTSFRVVISKLLLDRHCALSGGLWGCMWLGMELLMMILTFSVRVFGRGYTLVETIWLDRVLGCSRWVLQRFGRHLVQDILELSRFEGRRIDCLGLGISARTLN